LLTPVPGNELVAREASASICHDGVGRAVDEHAGDALVRAHRFLQSASNGTDAAQEIAVTTGEDNGKIPPRAMADGEHARCVDAVGLEYAGIERVKELDAWRHFCVEIPTRPALALHINHDGARAEFGLNAAGIHRLKLNVRAIAAVEAEYDGHRIIR
jgi:hypothetical protein